ncbi:MAG: CapA family protein [Acidobacteria bacterium]|nr:CapA family protein [Acidobacteriota bacterium]
MVPFFTFVGAMLAALASGVTGPDAPGNARARIALTGDLMCHDAQLRGGARPGGEWAFDEVFACVRPILSRADIASGNLETVLGGREARYTGYPMFNSPDALALSLRRAGFTLLTLANNHSMDRMSRGVQRTVTLLDRSGFLRTGSTPLVPSLAGGLLPPFFRVDGGDYPCLVEVRGVRVGVIAFTQLLNFPLPPQTTARTRTDDPSDIEAQLAAFRALPPDRRPDVVLAAVHWGNEYQAAPTPLQRKTARWLAENGVDVVVGSHPHVLQKAEWVTVDRGGKPAECLVLYSLGNFVSGQRTPPRDRSAIVWLEVGRAGGGLTPVKRAGFIPTFVRVRHDRGRPVFEVIPAAGAAAGTESPSPPAFPRMPEALAREVERVLTIPGGRFDRMDATVFLSGSTYRDPCPAAGAPHRRVASPSAGNASESDSGMARKNEPQGGSPCAPKPRTPSNGTPGPTRR